MSHHQHPHHPHHLPHGGMHQHRHHNNQQFPTSYSHFHRSAAAAGSGAGGHVVGHAPPPPPPPPPDVPTSMSGPSQNASVGGCSGSPSSSPNNAAAFYQYRAAFAAAAFQQHLNHHNVDSSSSNGVAATSPSNPSAPLPTPSLASASSSEQQPQNPEQINSELTATTNAKMDKTPVQSALPPPLPPPLQPAPHASSAFHHHRHQAFMDGRGPHHLMGYPPPGVAAAAAAAAAVRMQQQHHQQQFQHPNNGFHGNGYPHYNAATAAAATGLAMAMQRAQQMMMYNNGALNDGKEEQIRTRRDSGKKIIVAANSERNQCEKSAPFVNGDPPSERRARSPSSGAARLGESGGGSRGAERQPVDGAPRAGEEGSERDDDDEGDREEDRSVAAPLPSTPTPPPRADGVKEGDDDEGEVALPSASETLPPPALLETATTRERARDSGAKNGGEEDCIDPEREEEEEGARPEEDDGGGEGAKGAPEYERSNFDDDDDVAADAGGGGPAAEAAAATDTKNHSQAEDKARAVPPSPPPSPPAPPRQGEEGDDNDAAAAAAAAEGATATTASEKNLFGDSLSKESDVVVNAPPRSAERKNDVELSVVDHRTRGVNDKAVLSQRQQQPPPLEAVPTFGVHQHFQRPQPLPQQHHYPLLSPPQHHHPFAAAYYQRFARFPPPHHHPPLSPFHSKPFARFCPPPPPPPAYYPRSHFGPPRSKFESAPPPPPPPLPPPSGSNAQLLLREILNGKLALAAAVAQRQFFCGDQNQNSGKHHSGMDGGGMAMSTAANSGPRDFSRHNNNDLVKDNASAAATIMSLLKVRQEQMALNMSMENGVAKNSSEEGEENSSSGPNSPKDVDVDEDIVDRNANNSKDDNEDGGSPRSPLSDAGLSTSSGGGDKKSKASRLENLVSLMRGASSSPLPGQTGGAGAAGQPPVNGCKKRKLYQPVQHGDGASSGNQDSPKGVDENGDDNADEEEEELVMDHSRELEKGSDEPEEKKKKREEDSGEGSQVAAHLKRLQEQHQQKMDFGRHMHNDENVDPANRERHAPLPLPPSDKSLSTAASALLKQQPKMTNPFLNGPPPGLPPHMQFQYMEMARRLMQEQQDKITKEAITKEIISDTITNNSDIAEKLVAISPELKGLADILKTEITQSLAIIIDSIVGRFLQTRRQKQQEQQQKQLQAAAAAAASAVTGPKPFSLEDPLGLGGRSLGGGDRVESTSPRSGFPLGGPLDPASQGGNRRPRSHGHSGRAPQVRDRAAPRISANPISVSSVLPPRESPVVSTQSPISMSGHPFANGGNLLQELREMQQQQQSSPSIASDIAARDIEDQDSEDNLPASGEQDEALSLVVTPKKRRHKVTDSRITPRSLADLADLKNLPAAAAAALPLFPPPPQKMPLNETSPARGLPPPPPPPPPGLFPPGLPPHLQAAAAAAAAAGMPLPNPAALGDFAPFSPFYAAAAAAAAAAANRSGASRASSTAATTTTSTTTPILSALSPSRPPLPPVHHAEKVRDSGKRRPAAERDSPMPTLLPHPSLLSASSPSDFASNLREASESAQEEFNSMYSMSSYSLSEACSSTLTPMHLRKAKLMFFWTRYPSSAIIKMYFPDIKFNKNNTAQLVKWFSNFREFYYIQMEKYARQCLSEGLKHPEDIQVNLDAELYRVINLHYNRNNHIEVPDHFLPVVEATLREFFVAVRDGKDSESSWKKQIYKVIARYDEPIPEYFKTQEFLKQLE